MNIIDISVKRPLLVAVIFIILGGFGILGLVSLNTEMIPKLDLPVATVTVIYPGASATEVESSVTKKIEDYVASIENMKTLQSVSMENVSVVMAILQSGSNPDKAAEEIQRKINSHLADLPVGIKPPSVGKFSISETPIMRIAASSDKLSSTDFYNLMDKEVIPALSRVSGVANITSIGGTPREIKVNIDKNRLDGYGVSILQVLQAVRKSNVEIPLGKVEEEAQSYSVRFAGKYNSLEDLKNTVILNTYIGGSIKLSDVAEVEDGVEDITQINRINGVDAIGMEVMKQGDANAVLVSELINRELRKIENDHQDISLKFTVAADQSDFTRESVRSVLVDLGLAIIIVALVCFVFLHNVRSSSIMIITIPLSLLPAFFVLYLLDYSLNIVSLTALSLVVGIVVDDSIVVIEHISTYMEQGYDKWKAALKGAKQILLTCASITLVISIVFFPLVLATGMIANVFHEFAVPIITATLTSLLVSFTVTPALFSRIGKLSDTSKDTFGMRLARYFEQGFNSFRDLYTRFLNWSLHHKRWVILAALALFVGSFGLISAGFIGFEFLPKTDQPEFVINIEMNPQVSLQQNNKITAQIENYLRNIPEIEDVYSNVGRGMMIVAATAKNNTSQISVKLVDRKKRKMTTEAFAAGVKEEIMQMIPGIRVTTKATGLIESLGVDMYDIEFVFTGNDYNRVYETAVKARDIAERIPGSADVRLSVDDPRQEIKVEIDRDKMNSFGLSVDEVGYAMRVALNGYDECKYTENGLDYTILLRLDQFDRNNIKDVSSLKLMNRYTMKLTELKEFATITQDLGPTVLERKDRLASVSVRGNAVGRPAGTINAEIQAAIRGQIPDDITYKLAGVTDAQDESFTTLLISMLIAIALIYLVMVALYNSLLHPFVVLFSIPLAVIGSILALALTMESLNVVSMLGMLALIGVVAKNAILLVDFTNHARANGLNIHDALVEAGKERLRPILMTTLAMVFGMLPLALASGAGAEMKNGMAWVIIGGLISSLLLTLVIVPSMYMILEGVKERLVKKKQSS